MTAAADAYAWPPAWARDLVPATADVDRAALYLAIEAGGWPAPTSPRAAERRAFALVVLASLDSRGGGATRLDLATVGDRLARLGVAGDDRAAAARLAEARLALPPLAPFVGQPGDYRPFIVDGGFLYHERDLRLEQRLAGAIAARLDGPQTPAPAASPHGIEGRWTPEQVAAIDAARRRSLTVISGGPGTGKTALIGGIVRAWLAAGIAARRDRDRRAHGQGGQPHRRAASAAPPTTRPCPPRCTACSAAWLRPAARSGCAAASSATTRTAPCPTPPSSSTKRRWSGSR